jgi:MoaA/NifB/PqqE/SkfB family radical SAM enzyme
MHLPETTIADKPADKAPQFAPPTVKFLSLELTNRCNLKCVHCYTESTPESGDDDLMSADNYESVMLQAYALGCRVVQFIGGEAQLSPDFYRLLKKAKSIGNILRFSLISRDFPRKS